MKDDSPPKKVTSGIAKFGGMGYGNIMAEMKARQEKRTSVAPKVIIYLLNIFFKTLYY